MVNDKPTYGWIHPRKDTTMHVCMFSNIFGLKEPLEVGKTYFLQIGEGEKVPMEFVGKQRGELPYRFEYQEESFPITGTNDDGYPLRQQEDVEELWNPKE